MNRRNFLTLIGASGATLLLPACDDMPASAIAPWQGPAVGETDPRVRALAWALLAPNPHNLQSWRADIRQPGEISLSVDLTRLLPETDPPNRQILIGCGAFLELLSLAAAQDGYRAEITLYPEGVYGEHIDERPFAKVRLQQDPGVRPDSLFAAVRERHTNRLPYTTQVPGAVQLGQLKQACTTAAIRFGSVTQTDQVTAVNALALDGYRIEFAVPRTWQESARVMRVGADAVAANPSGLPLLGTQIWWGRQLGIVNPAFLLDSKGEAAKQALDGMTTLFTSGTSAWVWLAGGNSRSDQIEAGRSYLRLCLSAAQLGLAIHPNSQVLQEFAEMQTPYQQIHQTLGVSAPQRIQMLARIGYASTVPPAPRRPVTQLIKT